MRLTNGVLCCPEGLRRDLDLNVENGRLRLEPAAPAVHVHQDKPAEAGTPNSSVLLSEQDQPVETVNLTHMPTAGKASEPAIDLQGRYVLPGFIEVHTHGAGLFEFTSGMYDPVTGEFDPDPASYSAGLPHYAACRAAGGATTVYPGTWAAPVERLHLTFKLFKEYLDSGRNGQDGCYFPGAFLEGTFLNPAMAGAQNPKCTFPPDPELFKRLNETGVIRLANVVPDSGEPAFALMDRLRAKGISIGAGHSKATAAQFRAALDHGLKYFIHLLNGPTGNSYKTFDGGGPLEAVLQEDRIYAEIISDGIHVAPAYVRDVLVRKGTDKVMAVSDAIFISQAQGIETFVLSGIRGRVDPTGRYAYVVDSQPLSLFSSVITMDVAFSNLLSWLTREMPGVWYRSHPALPLAEAIRVASACCSGNIAAMLRADGGDNLETGMLANGLRADLLVATISGRPGEYRLEPKQVFVRGRKVWEKA